MGDDYSNPKCMTDRFTLLLFGNKKLSAEEVKEYIEERRESITLTDKNINEILGMVEDGMIEAKYVQKEDRIVFRVGKSLRGRIGDNPEVLFTPGYL